MGSVRWACALSRPQTDLSSSGRSAARRPDNDRVRLQHLQRHLAVGCGEGAVEVGEVLVAELNSVIADETVDAAADAAAFKARCSSLLGRIPDPYWKKR